MLEQSIKTNTDHKIKIIILFIIIITIIGMIIKMRLGLKLDMMLRIIKIEMMVEWVVEIKSLLKTELEVMNKGQEQEVATVLKGKINIKMIILKMM
jgi:hypothetical protein